MTKLLRIYNDMTFTEKTVKVRENKLQLGKTYTPTFKIGVSVFKERPFNLIKRVLMFWRRPRSILLLIDGSPQAMSLEPPSGSEEKPALAFNWGTMKDAERFIYKLTAKAKAESKPISNTQFLVIALLLGVVVIFQLMMMQGVSLG